MRKQHDQRGHSPYGHQRNHRVVSHQVLGSAREHIQSGDRGECWEEAATGDKRRAGYVVIDVEVMKTSVLIHPVTLMELAELETRLAEPDRLMPAKSICLRTP